MARAEGPAAQIAADASELGRALDAGQPARLPAARALSGMYVATAGQIPQWLPPARALRRGSGWRDPAPRHPVRPGRGHPADAETTKSAFKAGTRAGHRQKIHVVGCLMAGCLVAGSLVRGEVRTGRAERARRVVRANAEARTRRRFRPGCWAARLTGRLLVCTRRRTCRRACWYRIRGRRPDQAPCTACTW